MNVSHFLARRFLGGRKGGLLGTVSALAFSGVALGIAALVVAMGLMSGYRGELATKLAGTNAEVLVVPEEGPSEAEMQRTLSALPGVAAVAPTAFAQGLLVSPSVPGGVDAVLKALDLPAGLETTRLLGQVPGLAGKLAPRAGEPTRALLGSGLASRLGVREGETILLETATVSLSKGIVPPRRTPLVVAAVVETGFSEVDDGWAVLPREAFLAVAPPDAKEGLWELRLKTPLEADATVAAARKALPGATVMDWRALNRDLFAALAVQQTLLFVALVLIVAVACGTVVSSVVVLIAARTRDIGLLSALGATPAVVSGTFRRAGLLIGASGILAGTLFGLVTCAVLTATRAIRFPPEIAKIYYIGWMPFRPEPLHVLGISAAALLLVLLAAYLPARRAARLAPAEALRYE